MIIPDDNFLLKKGNKLRRSQFSQHFEKSLHQGEFVESEEVTGTTDINPISKIPPPNPVKASAFYQKGEDYIQVMHQIISPLSAPIAPSWMDVAPNGIVWHFS